MRGRSGSQDEKKPEGDPDGSPCHDWIARAESEIHSATGKSTVERKVLKAGKLRACLSCLSGPNTITLLSQSLLACHTKN